MVEVMYKPFGEDQMVTDVKEVSAMQKAPVGTPEGAGLLVIIHEGKNLEGKHHTNPSVRVLFHGKEKRTKACFPNSKLTLIAS